MKLRLSLKARIQILITVLLISVVGAPLYYLVLQMDRIQNELITNMMETTSQTFYQVAVESFMANDSTGMKRTFEVFSQYPGIDRVRIYNPAGEIRYSSNPAEITQLEQTMLVEDKNFLESYTYDANTVTHNHLILAQQECYSCHQKDQELLGVMQLTMRVDDSGEIYADVKTWLVLSGVFIVALLWLLLNYLYYSQIETKLQKIIDGFRSLAQGNLETHVDIPGEHELSYLSNRFNDTVEQLRLTREKEEELVRESLMHADRLVNLGAIAADIAHQINNPAGILRTRAETLKDDLIESGVGDKYINELDVIIDQTDTIAKTTRRILHNAQMLPDDFESLDLNGLVQNVIESMEAILNEKKAKIVFTPHPKNVKINGSTSQLPQVFYNLINNSLDACTRGQSEIGITISCDEEAENSIKIVYTDNGPGIAPEIQDEVFMPFFSTKSKVSSSGLGLFMVRVIISHHHGTIKLARSSENGVVFTIKLKVADVC